MYSYIPVKLVARPIEAENNCASIVGRWDHRVVIDSRVYSRSVLWVGGIRMSLSGYGHIESRGEEGKMEDDG